MIALLGTTVGRTAVDLERGVGDRIGEEVDDGSDRLELPVDGPVASGGTVEQVQELDERGRGGDESGSLGPDGLLTTTEQLEPTLAQVLPPMQAYFRWAIA